MTQANQIHFSSRVQLQLSQIGMATSSSQQPAASHREALSKLDSQLTCAVCLDRYTEPKTLPCLHIYCKKCLDELVQLGGELRCPSCRKPTRLSERGTSGLPTAFYINSLLEIDAVLRKEAAVVPLCHDHNDRPKDLYCEKCETHICFKCSTDSHRNHNCDRSEYLFTKHKQQIETSLLSVKQQIDEVEQTLARYVTREKEMRDQEEAVQMEIDAAYQQLIDQLQESRRNLSRQATTELQEKLKLHCFQKANVESVLLKLKNCHELVEEELRSRSQYQIQEAKGELVRLITETHSEVEVNKLQPAQEANITFIRTTGSGHVGMISSNQTTSFPGLFTVEIPSNVRVYEKTEVVLTAHLPLSARRLSCGLDSLLGYSPTECPITCTKEGQFIITICSYHVGDQKLIIRLDGKEIYGSPFSVCVENAASVAIPEQTSHQVVLYRKVVDFITKYWQVAKELETLMLGRNAMMDSRAAGRPFNVSRFNNLMQVITSRTNTMRVLGTSLNNVPDSMLLIPEIRQLYEGLMNCVQRIDRYSIEYNQQIAALTNSAPARS